MIESRGDALRKTQGMKRLRYVTVLVPTSKTIRTFDLIMCFVDASPGNIYYVRADRSPVSHTPSVSRLSGSVTLFRDSNQ